MKSPKGIAALILSKAKPKEDDGEDMESGLDDASGEVLSAIEAGDAMALKEALRSFVSMCSDYAD